MGLDLSLPVCVKENQEIQKIQRRPTMAGRSLPLAGTRMQPQVRPVWRRHEDEGVCSGGGVAEGETDFKCAIFRLTSLKDFVFLCMPSFQASLHPTPTHTSLLHLRN